MNTDFLEVGSWKLEVGNRRLELIADIERVIWSRDDGIDLVFICMNPCSSVVAFLLPFA
jgi:hypothetical protein